MVQIAGTRGYNKFKESPNPGLVILDKTLKWVECVPKMKGPALGKYPRAFLLLANSLPNFDLKKNDSDLCKGFFMGKKWPKFTII
jgi:hypothetical protein